MRFVTTHSHFDVLFLNVRGHCLCFDTLCLLQDQRKQDRIRLINSDKSLC